MKTSINILKYIILFIFSMTLISKLSDFEEFKHQLFLSPLIPPNYIMLIAYLTIFSETVILICLFFNELNGLGFLFSSFLLSLFGFYLLFLLMEYQFNKPCGCGFIFSFLSYSQHIIVNFSLSAFAAVAFVFYNKLAQQKITKGITND